MKRATLISQGSLNRIFQEVNQNWRQRRFQPALEALERASRLDPGNSGILLDLGRLYGLRYDYVAAERCLEKAVRMAPNRTQALAIAGNQCRDFPSLVLAERYFLQAIEQKGGAPVEVFVQLAKLYDRLRRLDEAAGMVARALQASPHHPEALLTRARLERQAGQTETAETTLRSLAKLSNPDVWMLAQTWYELGLLLDRQAKYDDAMAAFGQAKAALQPQAGRFIHELKIVRQRIALMQSTLTPETIQRWLAAAPAPPPPRRLALLGGHPRSGTTLLEQVLDAHPAITSLEETEIFHDDAYMPLANRLPDDTPMLSFIDAAPPEALRQSRTGYFRSAELFLGRPIGERLLIDKNPSVTFLIPALLRIFPEIKLLIALRDPRDVVLSCFMQPIPLGQVSAGYLTLESAAQEYCAMMSLWQDLKPMIAGRFLEVRYEDMVTNLESVARKSLDFLGVPWDATVLGFDEHARKKLVRSPTYADVTQPVYQRAKGRWRNYQKYLEPHLAKLEPFVKAFGYE